MEVSDINKASDFGGYSPAHRRRLRSNRGYNTTTWARTRTKNWPSDQHRPPTTWNCCSPYHCPLSLAPLTSAYSPAQGTTCFSTSTTLNSTPSNTTNRYASPSPAQNAVSLINEKHAAQCHVPKCPGPKEIIVTGVQCDM